MKRHKCKFLGCPCWLGIDVDQRESDVPPRFAKLVRELGDLAREREAAIRKLGEMAEKGWLGP